MSREAMQKALDALERYEYAEARVILRAALSGPPVQEPSEKECDMSREKIKVVDMARFFVPEGAYSIAELEELLALFKSAKERQDTALARFMQEVK